MMIMYQRKIWNKHLGVTGLSVIFCPVVQERYVQGWMRRCPFLTCFGSSSRKTSQKEWKQEEKKKSSPVERWKKGRKEEGRGKICLNIVIRIISEVKWLESTTPCDHHFWEEKDDHLSFSSPVVMFRTSTVSETLEFCEKWAINSLPGDL